MPQRQGDKETRRQGDKGTRRRGDKETRCFSPCLLVPLSPCLLVFLSLSLSLRLSVAGQIKAFEKQAISSAQEMSASDLDEWLPNRPFASWFSEVVRPKGGGIWQLTECGEGTPAPARGRADSGS